MDESLMEPGMDEFLMEPGLDEFLREPGLDESLLEPGMDDSASVTELEVSNNCLFTGIEKQDLPNKPIVNIAYI